MADTTYEAKFDYDRERDDVLSFHKGEHFEIVNKTNDKWWVAKRLSDGSTGYVPSVYLRMSNLRVIGKLIPEKRRNTKEHDIHIQALAELHRKVKPTPAHVSSVSLGIRIPSSDEEDEEQNVPTHQRKSAPAAVPLFLKVFKPVEVHPQRRSFSVRGSVSPSPPSPTPMHSRSLSLKGETRIPSPSPSSSQPFLSSPSAEYKPPPGVSKKPPVAVPKKSPVSQPSAFEFKTPPQFMHKLPPLNNNTTSNGTPYQFPPPSCNVPPPDPDYDQDEDDDMAEIPYHHKLNSSGRISSQSSDESNDLPSPPSPTTVGKSPFDLQHPSADDGKLIQPKPLPNPVKSSRNHQQLHRDLKMSIKTHGVGNVPIDSKPELAKKFQERKWAEKQKEIDEEKKTRRTSMEVKLLERLKMEEEEEPKKNKESLPDVKEQPEFMKVRLKHTSTPS